MVMQLVPVGQSLCPLSHGISHEQNELTEQPAMPQ